MSHISLKAEKREGKVKEAGVIPAVVYGPGSANQSLKINYREFEKAFQAAGESTLIDLSVGTESPVKVLVHDIQRAPVSNDYTHIDFYQLDMHKKLKVEIELHFKNIEAVEKSTGGEVIRNTDKLEVECLPKDLVKEIEIDLTEYLKAIGDVFRAKDVKLTAGLELAIDGESPIASIQEIKEEVIEEVAAPETVVEGEEKKAEAEAKAAEEGAVEGTAKKEEKGGKKLEK
jgi:large subunit ribosomal protein L25